MKLTFKLVCAMSAILCVHSVAATTFSETDIAGLIDIANYNKSEVVDYVNDYNFCSSAEKITPFLQGRKSQIVFSDDETMDIILFDVSTPDCRRVRVSTLCTNEISFELTKNRSFKSRTISYQLVYGRIVDLKWEGPNGKHYGIKEINHKNVVIRYDKNFCEKLADWGYEVFSGCIYNESDAGFCTRQLPVPLECRPYYTPKPNPFGQKFYLEDSASGGLSRGKAGLKCQQFSETPYNVR